MGTLTQLWTPHLDGIETKLGYTYRTTAGRPVADVTHRILELLFYVKGMQCVGVFSFIRSYLKQRTYGPRTEIAKRQLMNMSLWVYVYIVESVLLILLAFT